MSTASSVEESIIILVKSSCENLYLYESIKESGKGLINLTSFFCKKDVQEEDEGKISTPIWSEGTPERRSSGQSGGRITGS